MMKKSLLTILCVLLSTISWAQGTTAGDSTAVAEPYAVLSENNTVLTFYYDENKTSRNGMSVEPVSGPYAIPWYDAHNTITNVVFEPAFGKCTTLTSTANWFYECTALTSISGIEYLNTTNVTDMHQMFTGCTSLTSLTLDGLNTSNVANMNSMFLSCSALTQLSININTENVTDMGYMFQYCGALTSLDLSSFNTAKVTEMEYIFYDCSQVTTIYVGSGWINNPDIHANDMFHGCSSLVGGNGTAFDSRYTSYAYAHIDGGTDNPGYFTDKNASYNEAYGVLVIDENNTASLTMYYDANRDAHREGQVIGLDEMMQNQAWMMYRENVTTVVFDSSFAECRPTSTAFWFAYCRSLTSIVGLQYLRTDETTNMSFMFNECSSLTSLDLSSLNTENVTNISGMLGGCRSLTSVDLSGFNTRQVTNMNSLFEQSAALTTINLSSFNTSQVTDMSYMFNECSALTTIYVGSDWSTEAVTNGTDMFNKCTNLVGGAGTTFSADHIDHTYARIDAEGTPGYLTDSKNASMTHFVMITVEGNGEVSAGQAAVIRDKGDVHVADGEPLEMFFFPDEGYQLTSVKIDTLDVTSQVTPATEYSAASYTIPGIYGDIAITVTFAQTSTDAELEAYAALSEDNTVLTFYYDSQKTARGGMGVGPFNITWDDNLQANIINSGWYDYKEKITRVVFDTSFANAVDITSTSYWFYGMTNLTVFEGIENLKTQSVTSMDAMFWGCSNLVSLDLSSFDTQNVTTMSDMFRDCSALTSLDVNSFNTANVTNMLYMFRFCSSLTNLGVTSFNTQNVTNMYGMFEGCSSLTALDVTSFNTQKVVDMGFMFSSCHGLTSLDLSAFNTQNVIYMRCMFYECLNLNTIYVGSGWSTASVTESPYMFDHCTALVGGAGTTFDADHVDHTYAHIDGGTANPGYFTASDKVATPVFFLEGDKLAISTSTEGADILYSVTGYSTAPSGDGTQTSPYNVTALLQTFSNLTADVVAASKSYVRGIVSFVQYEYDTTYGNASFYISDDGTRNNEFFGWRLRYLNGMRYGEGERQVKVGDEVTIYCDSVVYYRGTVYETSPNRNTLYDYEQDTNASYLYAFTTPELSTLYEGPMSVSNNVIVRAKATKQGMTDSDMAMLTIGDPEPYAVLSDNNSVLTFYYDGNKARRNGMSVGPFTTFSEREWESNRGVSSVVFDASFADFTTLTSTAYWFYGFTNLTTITGIEHLNTANVEDMGEMFSGCSSLTSIDLSNFVTDKVSNMLAMFLGCSSLTTLDISSFSTNSLVELGYMFSSCSALTTIYSGSGWAKTFDSSNGIDVFIGSTNLVGGAGTTYNFNYTDATYARIDGGASAPGFFTDKNATTTEQVAAPTFSWSNDNLTISTTTEDADIYYSMATPKLFTDFNYGTIPESGWRITRGTDVAYTSAEGPDGTQAAKYDNNSARENYWDSQFAYTLSDSLKVNTPYTLRFKARSTSADGVLQFMYENATNYNHTGGSTVLNIGTEWAEYEVQFTISEPSYIDVNHLCLNFGTVVASYYIDDICLFEGTQYGTPERYTSPVEVKNDVVIMAWAEKSGMNTSLNAWLDYPYEAWNRLYDVCMFGIDLTQKAASSPRVNEQMVKDAEQLTMMCYEMYMERTASREEVEDRKDMLLAFLSEIEKMMQVPATYSNYVLTAEEDATMAEIADQYGSYYGNQVAAIVWNSSVPMTESDLQRFTSNPNLLIYAQSESMVPANRNNVVINGVAKNVVLTTTASGNCNFFAPETFTAEAIQYTRTFNQQTQIGVSRGWEAIALPFTVQTYTHADRGVIAPFGNSASENHFWLRELTQNGLQNAQTIEANKPYIISMPNSEEYRPETNLAGQVTFSALNAIVPVTEATPVEYGSISLVPAFQSRSAQTEIYALNVGEERNGYPEGSVFERDYRTVRPFEAYTLHRDNQNPAPQFIMIGGDMGNGTTGIEELVDKRMNTNDSWYTIDGRKLQGAPTSKGLYIRNGKKVIVR